MHPLAVLLLACTGCAVGPKFSRPEAQLSRNWSTTDPSLTAQKAVDELWWRSFNDASLDRLVEAATRQNLPLQIAGLRIIEARARLGFATGQQFPQTQETFGSATAVGLSQAGANTAQLPTRHFLDFQLGFDAAWELDFWGKYRRGVEAEADSLMASVGDYYAALVALTAEVARTYVAIRTNELLIMLARDNERVQEQGLQIAQARLRNGATSELDVTQAAALLEGTRASIPRLEAALQQSHNALSTLLGQPTGAISWMLQGPQSQIPQPPREIAVSVPAELLRRRPDIRSAELQAAAQCARVGVARTELFPSFSLFGQVSFQASPSGSGVNNFLQDLSYSLGPRVSWPFLNYGRIRNTIRVEDARYQQLLISYRSSVLQAAQEVEDAIAGFARSKEAQVSEERAVVAAQRSVEISMVQYREGAVDFQRVLDAERSLLVEQNNLAQIRSAVTTNLIALYKALGGGWEQRQSQPFVPDNTQDEMARRTSWSDMLTQPAASDVRPAESSRPHGEAAPQKP
jgi:NodT family efflux transporter outer membrane factor (OMF) lipoprotein